MNGAVVIVFDLNNEYEGLAMNKDGSKNELSEKIIRAGAGAYSEVCPGLLGRIQPDSLMQHVLDAPGASLREFVRIINSLEHTERFSMDGLGEAIQSWRGNELVKDALYSRFQTMRSSGIFAGEKQESVRVDSMISPSYPAEEH